MLSALQTNTRPEEGAHAGTQERAWARTASTGRCGASLQTELHSGLAPQFAIFRVKSHSHHGWLTHRQDAPAKQPVQNTHTQGGEQPPADRTLSFSRWGQQSPVPGLAGNGK